MAPEALDTLREAYQTLANPARREAYDGTIRTVLPRKAAPARPMDDFHAADSGGLWNAPWFRFGVPVALIIVAVWGWKARHKPPAPATARIVEMRTIVPGSATNVDSFVPPTGDTSRANVASASPAPASAAGSRSAEGVFAAVSGSVARVLVSDAADRRLKQGSAVVIGSEQVITNCHVVSGGQRIAVKAGADSRPASIASPTRSSIFASSTCRDWKRPP